MTSNAASAAEAVGVIEHDFMKMKEAVGADGEDGAELDLDDHDVSSANDFVDAKRPSQSYARLAVQAITSLGGRAKVVEIYGWIQYNHPYYKNGTQYWRNCIRHNLSIKNFFQRSGPYWYYLPELDDMLETRKKRKSTGVATNNVHLTQMQLQAAMEQEQQLIDQHIQRHQAIADERERVVTVGVPAGRTAHSIMLPQHAEVHVPAQNRADMMTREPRGPPQQQVPAMPSGIHGAMYGVPNMQPHMMMQMGMPPHRYDIPPHMMAMPQPHMMAMPMSMPMSLNAVTSSMHAHAQLVAQSQDGTAALPPHPMHHAPPHKMHSPSHNMHAPLHTMHAEATFAADQLRHKEAWATLRAAEILTNPTSKEVYSAWRKSGVLLTSQDMEERRRNPPVYMFDPSKQIDGMPLVPLTRSVPLAKVSAPIGTKKKSSNKALIKLNESPREDKAHELKRAQTDGPSGTAKFRRVDSDGSTVLGGVIRAFAPQVVSMPCEVRRVTFGPEKPAIGFHPTTSALFHFRKGGLF